VGVSRTDLQEATRQAQVMHINQMKRAVPEVISVLPEE
jgi:hypothetical protein